MNKLFIPILACTLIFGISNMVYGAYSSDYDHDKDVDGLDLSILSADYNEAALAALAVDFGKNIETELSVIFRTFYETLTKAEDGGTQAYLDVVNQLNATEFFQNVQLSEDGNTLIFTYEDGFILHVGTGPSPTDFVESDSMVTDSMATSLLQDISQPNSHGIKTSSVITLNEDVTPGSKKVLVFLPFLHDGMETTLNSAALKYFEDKGYTIQIYTDAQCSLKNFMDAITGDDYGIIVVMSHGGIDQDGNTFFVIADDLNDYYVDDDLKTRVNSINNLVPRGIDVYINTFKVPWWDLYSRIIVNPHKESNCEEQGRCHNLTIDSSVIAHYANLNNTLVWMGSCKSFFKLDMAEAFLSKGAGAYLGWKNFVGSPIDEASFHIFMKELIKHGTTARGAHLAAQHDWDLRFITDEATLNTEEGDQILAYFVSHVKDLEIHTKPDTRFLLEAFPPPINELDGTYEIIRLTSQSGQFPDGENKNHTTLHADSDGNISGTFNFSDIEGNVIGQYDILEGRIEGVNFYFTFWNTDESTSFPYVSPDPQVLYTYSGRASYTFLSPTEIVPTFEALTGLKWYKYFGKIQYKRDDYGNWMSMSRSEY